MCSPDVLTSNYDQYVSQGTSTVPHIVTQGELALVRDLELSKAKAVLLGSRLLQSNQDIQENMPM